jgi:hypothetical protein
MYCNSLHILALQYFSDNPEAQKFVMEKFAQAIALVLVEGIERGITLDIPLDYKWLECEKEYYNSAGFQELIASQEVFNMQDFIGATNLSDRIVGMIFAEINVNVLYRSAHLWGGPAWLDNEILSFGSTDSSSAVSPENDSRSNRPSRLMWADSVTPNTELPSFPASSEESSYFYSFFGYFSVLSLLGGSLYLLCSFISYLLVPLPPIEGMLDPSILSTLTYTSSPSLPAQVSIPADSGINDYLPSRTTTTVIITIVVVATLWSCGVPVPFLPL